jgi:putative transposase
VGNARGKRDQIGADPERVEHLRKAKHMAQTLVSLLVHVVFSTKNRVNVITPEIEPDLFAYMGGILRNNQSRLLDAGGTANHVHLLISQSKNIALSALLKDVKKDSSKWIKTNGTAFRGFHWQDGYAGFSIGQSNITALKRYIAKQKEHHKKRTFQEELLELLKKYEMEYDERYLWD